MSKEHNSGNEKKKVAFIKLMALCFRLVEENFKELFFKMKKLIVKTKSEREKQRFICQINICDVSKKYHVG